MNLRALFRDAFLPLLPALLVIAGLLIVGLTQ